MVRLHIESAQDFGPGGLEGVTQTLQEIGFEILADTCRPDYNSDSHIFCGFCGQMIHANVWLEHRPRCRRTANDVEPLVPMPCETSATDSSHPGQYNPARQEPRPF